MKIVVSALAGARWRPDNVPAMSRPRVAVGLAEVLKPPHQIKPRRKLRADRDNRRQCKSISMGYRSESYLCPACLSANIHLCSLALTEWFSISRLCARKAPAQAVGQAAAVAN
jgi:hypothetical protein